MTTIKPLVWKEKSSSEVIASTTLGDFRIRWTNQKHNIFTIWTPWSSECFYYSMTLEAIKLKVSKDYERRVLGCVEL